MTFGAFFVRDKISSKAKQTEEKMGMKVSKIKQKYLDLARVEALRIKLEEKLPPDSGLHLDVMIALSVLSECFKYGFVERVDE